MISPVISFRTAVPSLRIFVTSFQTNLKTFLAPFSSIETDDNIDPTSTARTPPPNSTPEEFRMRALSLYRQLLRSADKMPTPNRSNYIRTKTKAEYEKYKNLDPVKDAEQIEFQLRLADTNLDTVMVQAEHLTRLYNDPDYQNYN
mmetsp:Transcript_5378/g.11031  ORF Transcript_5378/g.11031 Transcript_5378/m.11031 type:complete len:145 (+) Transcript_5378:218-652(+)